MLCVMGFIGAFCINIMRNNLSVGIVFMTDRNTTGNDSTATDDTKDLMKQMNIGRTNDYYSLYGSSSNGNRKGAILNTISVSSLKIIDSLIDLTTFIIS